MLKSSTSHACIIFSLLLSSNTIVWIYSRLTMTNYEKFESKRIFAKLSTRFKTYVYIFLISAISHKYFLLFQSKMAQSNTIHKLSCRIFNLNRHNELNLKGRYDIQFLKSRKLKNNTILRTQFKHKI